MDLFHGNKTEEVEGPWNDVENGLPKCDSEKVKVKLSTGNEILAYFYSDGCYWIEKYGKKGSYFWDCQTKEPLLNVEKWKHLKSVEVNDG